MAHILLFPSVLGVRRGITDLAEMLTGVGHSVTTVDILDGETFDDYETAGARSQEVGLPAQMATALERTAGEPPFVAIGFSGGAGMAQWVASQRPDDVRGLVQAGGAYTFVEYQGAGHLFNDPTLPDEYQPEEARILTRRILEFVDAVG